MNKKETLEVLKIVVAAFPNFKIEDAQLTVEVWYEILKDVELNEAKNNLKSYIRTGSAFPPVVGQLLTKKETNTVASVQETMLRIQQEDRERAERQKLIQSPQEQEEIKKLHEQKRAELNLDWNRG